MATNKATPTEIGYLSGVTSAIQTQINNISGGIAPTVVTSTLAADFSTNSATYVDTGLSCTFTVTTTNDPILVQFGGTWASVTSPGNFALAFAFDGGTEDCMLSLSTAGRQNPSIQKVYTNLAAGSHTVKLRARNTGSAATHFLVFHGTDNEVPTLQVIKFR